MKTVWVIAKKDEKKKDRWTTISNPQQPSVEMKFKSSKEAIEAIYWSLYRAGKLFFPLLALIKKQEVGAFGLPNFRSRFLFKDAIEIVFPSEVEALMAGQKAVPRLQRWLDTVHPIPDMDWDKPLAFRILEDIRSVQEEMVNEPRPENKVVELFPARERGNEGNWGSPPQNFP
jgi:hypothetical protein